LPRLHRQNKATFHSEQCLAYGTLLMGGVTPGRGGEKHLGYRYSTRRKKRFLKTGATVSMIYVPAPFAADAILEAADAVRSLMSASRRDTGE